MESGCRAVLVGAPEVMHSEGLSHDRREGGTGHRLGPGARGSSFHISKI